jgi:hypothetical protein
MLREEAFYKGFQNNIPSNLGPKGRRLGEAGIEASSLPRQRRHRSLNSGLASSRRALPASPVTAALPAR